ncbi:Uncharacterised protein [Shigella flexneri]|nr:Uncharacterised protein [Shigella flexneri]
MNRRSVATVNFGHKKNQPKLDSCVGYLSVVMCLFNYLSIYCSAVIWLESIGRIAFAALFNALS